MQTQCPHCKSRYRLSSETIEAFGGFVRCGNCNYKFNVHDQVQMERNYFELSSADELDEEAPVRLHAMGGIDDDEISAPPSGRVEPVLEVEDDGLNIRFSADEFGQRSLLAEEPSNPKVEPRFEAFYEEPEADVQVPAEPLPTLRIEADAELETGGENVIFSASDVSLDETKPATISASADPDLNEFAYTQGFVEVSTPDDGIDSPAANVVADSRSYILDEEVAAGVATSVDDSVADSKIEASAAIAPDSEELVLEEGDSQTGSSEPDELDRLFDTSDGDEKATESPVSKLSSEPDYSELEIVVSEMQSTATQPESQLDNFGWSLDSMDEQQDSKPLPVFDDDQTESEDQAQSESDPLEAFTFGRDFGEEMRDDEMPDSASQGEVHTLLNVDEDEQLAGAPGFAHRFAAGLGHFMLFGFWLLLSVGLVYVLIGQVKDRVYTQIKSEPIVQDMRNRLCSFLPCTVSKYDADKYEIVVSRMDEVRDPNRQLHISVFLLNRAELAQVYPSLRITFKRLDGSTVGQRVIGPDEYSTSSNRVIMAGDGAGGVTKPMIKPNKLGKILIRFNNPPADAVGFEAQVAP